jgi:hypothetical protein
MSPAANSTPSHSELPSPGSCPYLYIITHRLPTTLFNPNQVNHGLAKVNLTLERAMILKTLVALAACAHSALAAPYPHDTTSLIHARAANSTACPGYTATNIAVTDAGLTADLTLAGAACNAYSEDIKDLKLVVEHQTGMCPLLYTS